MRTRILTARRLVAAGTLLALASPAFAQTDFPETEPNGPKAEANVVNCMVAGDTISGTSTGTSTTAANTALASADTFRVKTCALPLGIYRHELVITTGGTAGHGGSIRGLSQTAGVPNAGTDSSAQTSSTATIPPRMNAWYGFGYGEEIYYRISGTTSTTAPYLSTLSTTPVAAASAGPFAAGPITITSCGVGHTTDTDLWVYDASLIGIPTYGNDDQSPACVGHGLGSGLTRDYTPGRYYLAITNFNFANNLGSTGPGEGFQSGVVLDFPDVATNSSTTDPLNVSFSVTDANGTTTVTATKSSDYGIVWIKFDVGSGGPGAPICVPGTFGTSPCICGNAPGGPGLGCANTGGPGGALSSAGSASLAADSVVLTGSGMFSGTFCVFVQGDVHNQAGAPLNSGVFCLGGALKRLYVKGIAAGASTAPVGADLSVSGQSAALGDPIAAGSSRYYQVVYRDPLAPDPGPPCPTRPRSNVTSGQQILWGP